MLKDYVEQGLDGGRHVPIAVGMDARSRGFDPADPPRDRPLDRRGRSRDPLSRLLRGRTHPPLRRARRRHPLAPDRPAEDGIARERNFTAPLRGAAESVLDTTDLSPAELRDELRRRYGGDVDQPVLTITSFAFARGMSRTADLVFDLRFIANPHWVDELRPLTGLDAGPRLCRRDEAWTPTMDRIEALLIDWIPRYWAAGKTYLTVAFGCTGGRHRSVAAAVEMAERLRRAGFSPNVRHRDLASRPSGTVEGNAGRGSAEAS